MTDEEDGEREEAASALANEITDAAMELVEEYQWSPEDVLAHVRAVLRGAHDD